MYKRLSVIVLSLSNFTSLCAVAVGDTEAQVIRELGQPNGTSQIGPGRVFMYFDRGTVLMDRGRVSIVNLSSKEDHERAKKLEAAEKAEAERIRLANERLEEIKKQEKAKEEAKEAAQERRRNRPKLSGSTLFEAAHAIKPSPIEVESVAISLTQQPAPPPYNEIRWGNSGGGNSYRYVATVYPPAPPPTAITFRIMVSNKTSEPLTGLDVIYTLEFVDKKPSPVTNSLNRAEVIYPGTSGMLQVTVALSDKDEWENFQDLEKVDVKLIKAGSNLNNSRTTWVRKDGK